MISTESTLSPKNLRRSEASVMPAAQRQKSSKKEPPPSSAKANGHSSPKAAPKDKERPRVSEAGKRGDSKPRSEVAQSSKPSAVKAEPVRASKQATPAAGKAQHTVANAKNKKAATPPTKIARKEPQMPNVFDSILNELDNLETTRKKEPQKAHSKDSHNSDPDDLTPGTSKQPMPPTPTPNANARPLTRTELTHCDPDDSLMKRFLEKDGFMERLLGYKMLKGRVDSHFVMRSNIKLDNCVFVEVPEPGDDVMGRSKWEALKAEWEASTRTGRQVHEIVEIEADERRGPKTPPGSPGHNSSRASTVLSLAVDEKSHDVPGDLCSPLPPPPVFPALAGSPPNEAVGHARQEPSTSAGDGRENLRQLALLTGTPVAQLEEFMGDDIREMMGQADKATMLAAVKDALRNTFLKQQSGVRKATQEDSKSNIPEKPGTIGSESQNDRRDESKSNAAEASACEMEISSGAASACGSDVFEALAPPPPPPFLPLAPADPALADISLSQVGVSQSTANATFSSVSLPSANVAPEPVVDWEAIKSRPPPGMPSQADAAPMPASFSMPPPTMLMVPVGPVTMTSTMTVPQTTDFSVPPPNLGAPPAFIAIQSVSSVAGPSLPVTVMPSSVGLEVTLPPATNVASSGPLAQTVMSQPPLSSFVTHSFSSASLPPVAGKSESWRKPTQTVPTTTAAGTFFTSVTGRPVTSATQLLSNTEIVAATTSMSPPPAASVQTRAEETLATRAEESLASMGTRGQVQHWNREQRNESPVPFQQRRRGSRDNEAPQRGKVQRRGSGGKNFKRPNQKRRSSGSEMDGPPMKKTPVNHSQPQYQQRGDTNGGGHFEPLPKQLPPPPQQPHHLPSLLSLPSVGPPMPSTSTNNAVNRPPPAAATLPDMSRPPPLRPPMPDGGPPQPPRQHQQRPPSPAPAPQPATNEQSVFKTLLNALSGPATSGVSGPSTAKSVSFVEPPPMVMRQPGMYSVRPPTPMRPAKAPNFIPINLTPPHAPVASTSDSGPTNQNTPPMPFKKNLTNANLGGSKQWNKNNDGAPRPRAQLADQTRFASPPQGPSPMMSGPPMGPPPGMRPPAMPRYFFQGPPRGPPGAPPVRPPNMPPQSFPTPPGNFGRPPSAPSFAQPPMMPPRGPPPRPMHQQQRMFGGGRNKGGRPAR